MRVLVVEDDPETADYITTSLRAEGHTVDHCDNGKDGFLNALDNDYDVMVFDRMLPGLDGLTLIKSVRGAGNETPIMFLSALDGIDDRVEGLKAGSDDYLIKPFSYQELSARLAALVRRPPLKAEETVLHVADLEMNLVRRTVSRGGTQIDLQPREFSLLEYLMRNADRVLTRTMLLEAVWDFHFDPKTSVVETHISRLRNKIDKPFARELIHTIRGAGYSLHG
ncbi:response regulator transcription factor [Phaeobacter sp. PT47_59]|uniref:winged helix-turn-helix domain-containing protein n=1 Tax=Phaeobacter sp. PT47_59 TaxID=3029979 RepID=UPI002380887F|nr:response regulator transcription factor [Phaeobacter sp. PT47_59]MDE4176279.1 response regulator transcription factor [Phaeobacter sp. PT47_59]